LRLIHAGVGVGVIDDAIGDAIREKDHGAGSSISF
jgi:hypothetical protein